MPKNPAIKKAAYAYAAEHGVTYVEALRVVREQRIQRDTSESIIRLDPTSPDQVSAAVTALGGTAIDASVGVATGPNGYMSPLVSDARAMSQTTSEHETCTAFADVRVDDKIRFSPQPGRGWWTVKARDARYVIAVQQAMFHPKGDLWYTIVDLTGWNHRYNGVGPGVVRSSTNRIGGGWALGPDGEGCDTMLAALVSGEVELSYRRVASVADVEVKKAPVPRR